MTSGGVPSTKRGWSVLLISWVAECLISAFGYFSLYMASWALAYSSPKPPLKMTTSSGASSLTPSGFWSLCWPFSSLVLLSPPPIAQAPSVVTAREPAPAACRSPRRLR